MNKAGKILSFSPPNVIPGGESLIECEGFKLTEIGTYGCYFNGIEGRLVGASANRVLVIVPEGLETTEPEVYLESGGDRSESKKITVGKKIADDLHLVANPAVDPKDDSIILTRSGSRGQQLPITLFRLEKDGYLNEMSADVMNPTGLAFNQSGELFVTARADGEVCRISRDDEVMPYASELGIATGIAFDKDGEMFVGDRSGTVFRVTSFGNAESFAVLEPSVSAYHLAFGADERLYLSAPGLCSYDSIHVIGKDGLESDFFRGLGRPQGLAFDRNGNLYVAACLQGRHGIVKVSPDGKSAEIFIAGMNIVGLCFTRKGEMIVATNETVYSLPLGIYGTLLD
jgi:sugar lactone lactonase YvrE